MLLFLIIYFTLNVKSDLFMPGVLEEVGPKMQILTELANFRDVYLSAGGRRHMGYRDR